MVRIVGSVEGAGNGGHSRARKWARVVSAICTGASLIVTAVVTAAATWAATAMVIGTTFVPDPTKPYYLHGSMEHYVDATTVCGVQTCAVQPVVTPEQFWPLSGWNHMTIDQSISLGASMVDDALLRELGSGSDPIVVFGDSQSSSILTLEKRSLSGLPDAQKDRIVLVLAANPNRPNGGLLERIAPVTIPVIGLTGTGATPTTSGINTTDIAFQYDGIADFPRYPLNILAILNVIAGADIHSSYMSGPRGYTEGELLDAINDPVNRQTYGDTTYITIPAKQLPLLDPLRQFGAATGQSAWTTPLADLAEPTLRVLVELGYDRSIPYGVPAKFGLFPDIDPAALAFDLSSAVQSGIDTALSDIGVNTPPAAPPATPVRSAQRSAVSAAAVRPPAAVPAIPASVAPRPIRKAEPATSEVNAATVSRPTRVTTVDRRQLRSNAGQQTARGSQSQAQG
jgi:hypothetical protein